MSLYRWVIEGHAVDLVEQDDSIVAHLRRGQTFEPDSLRTWIALTANGGTVVDVGCYTGLFSILAAKQGCDVVAFEPMRKNFERCVENFRENGVTVDIRYAAATDTPGQAEIRFNPRVSWLTSGASLIRPSGGRPGEQSPHMVDGITIDSLGLEQCTAIKIDVERGEPLVLAGARETLERCRPALLVEVLGPDEGKAVKAAVTGYEVAEVIDQRNWLMLPC